MSRFRAWFAAGVAGSLALVALWVSGQSFWIDECNAAVKAIQPDVPSFWAKFSSMRGSDFQMPLYMFLLWCWEKIVGCGEFALRALNIIFAWASMLVVASSHSQSRRFRFVWCLLAAVSPMFASYMNEARPYAMQFFAATLVWFGMIPDGGRQSPTCWNIPLFLFGIVLLCASSLTGVLFAFWPCLWLLFRLFSGKHFGPFLKRHKLSVAISFTLLVPLGIFYLYTLFAGSRASGMGSPDGKTLLFGMYEFLGFMGVGPSRLDLRSNPFSALRCFLPSISVFAVVTGGFVMISFRQWRKIAKHTSFPTSILVCAVLGIVMMIVVGFVFGMRVLARHWMPALPALLLFVAWIADCAWTFSKEFRSAFVLLLILLLYSSASLRFADRHLKDDYRSAAAFARAHVDAGETVWWAADGAALEYYGVAATHPSRFHILMNESDATLSRLPPPDFIVFSKPDVYDRAGALARFLVCGHFDLSGHCPAISFYQQTPDRF